MNNSPSETINDKSLKKLDDRTIIYLNGKYALKFKELAKRLARKLNTNSKTARNLQKKYFLQLNEKSLREWCKEIAAIKDEKELRGRR